MNTGDLSPTAVARLNDIRRLAREMEALLSAPPGSIAMLSDGSYEFEQARKHLNKALAFAVRAIAC